MSSLSIKTMREQYPGKSDVDAAKEYAKKHGFIAIVRYKNSASAADFTNIGTCIMEAEIHGYLNSPSPFLREVEIIYDGRSTALNITDDLILRGHCESCGKQATQKSLQLMAGNDFYICPKCGLMYCDRCYLNLPLTHSPGYGMCPNCKVQVQRAIPGYFGNQSGMA